MRGRRLGFVGGVLATERERPPVAHVDRRRRLRLRPEHRPHRQRPNQLETRARDIRSKITFTTAPGAGYLIPNINLVYYKDNRELRKGLVFWWKLPRD